MLSLQRGGGEMEKQMAQCIVCGKEMRREEGIFIRGQGICAHCEKLITELTSTSPYYERIEQNLKKIW